MKKEINKILIIRFSSLGDIMLTEPIPRLLRELYPMAEIHYLTKRAFAPIVANFKSIDKILFWENKAKLIKSLRADNYDLTVDLHDKINSCLVKKLTAARQTVTYKKQHLRRLLMTKKILKEPIYSTLNLYLSVFRQIKQQKYIYEKLPLLKKYQLLSKNITDIALPAELFPKLVLEKQLSKYIIDTFEEFNISHKKTLIGIFPGASFDSKQYPASYLSNFINNIPATWNCQFVLLGSHADKFVCTEIRKNCMQKPIDMSGFFELDKLIEFMSHLHGVISNDSGPMHLAAALGKPQIAIFGSTHTSLGFRPLNKKAQILEQNLRCQPCTLHGRKECPKRHFRCMKTINSKELTLAFKELLEEEILCN
ncbi:MAG TPA: lipopolysaccharide heptosyltransferase II [Candidatus Cloacimonadota bacterium]|nr:lipopolysaccharide heptosyltransferase II [Candidatus Cloacimonadota bacterium]HOQ79736.1 lipopolysaccharide heptosyltransferase II [Candidatus Cloacimonadota bacterium]HQB41750.1 lipopolysaccharide heptosyltransferase II [Candidatus Cloacimonadota bacterium]